jgi:hypothetical protein
MIFSQAVESSTTKTTTKPKGEVSETLIRKFKKLDAQNKILVGELSQVKDQLKDEYFEQFLTTYTDQGICPPCTWENIGVQWSIKDAYPKLTLDRFQQLNNEFNNIAEEKTVYQFNTSVLERNMAAIEKAIVGCKDISLEDKANLLVKKTTHAIRKGVLSNASHYGDIEKVIMSVMPIMALKSTDK